MTQEIEQRFQALLEAEEERRNLRFLDNQAINLSTGSGDGFGGRFFDPVRQTSERESQDIRSEGVVVYINA